MKNFLQNLFKSNTPVTGPTITPPATQAKASLPATIRAKVIRADGRVEDLGVVSSPSIEVSQEQLQELKNIQ